MNASLVLAPAALDARGRHRRYTRTVRRDNSAASCFGLVELCGRAIVLGLLRIGRARWLMISSLIAVLLDTALHTPSSTASSFLASRMKFPHRQSFGAAAWPP